MFYSLPFIFKRWQHGKIAARTPVAELYRQSPQSARQLFRDTRFLVVDCEMSGLDVNTSQLLSVGWVRIENGRIQNKSARHLLVHADRGAGDSTRIHGLSDASIAGANSAAAVLMLLLRQMINSVLVFHHAPVDIRFLQKACQENFRCPLLFSYLDTMEIEKRRLQLQGKQLGLRLGQCRERYNLPVARAHNALADAQATAELLLAQAAYLGNRDSLRLAELGLHCAG